MHFTRLSKLIQRTEEYTLSLLLFAMIILSCLQIILRQFFDSGLPWADPLLRHLVVWGGFLGATLAVSLNKHISLDIVSNFLPAQIRWLVITSTHLFCSIICGFLCYASWLFLISEYQFGNSALLFIPSWALNIIFPVSFAIMCLRYLSKTLVTATNRAIASPQSHEQP